MTKRPPTDALARFFATCALAALLGAVSPARASAQPQEMIVDSWKTDANGMLEATFDGYTWTKVKPPTRPPFHVVMQPSIGFWALKLDDGRTAYVDLNSFGSVRGTGTCVTAKNEAARLIENLNFSNCRQ